MDFRISHKPALFCILFCIHPSLLHLVSSWMLFVRASSKWLWRYFEFWTCIFWAFSTKPSRFNIFRKIYAFGELLDMLGRVLARSQHRNACPSSYLREGLMDNQDSEVVHLKFVACVSFLRLSSESVPYHVEVAAKQGGLVWKRRCYGVSISYQSRVKAVYHSFSNYFPMLLAIGRLAPKWAFSRSHKSAWGLFLRVWHVKIRVGVRSIGIDSWNIRSSE